MYPTFYIGLLIIISFLSFPFLHHTIFEQAITGNFSRKSGYSKDRFISTILLIILADFHSSVVETTSILPLILTSPSLFSTFFEDSFKYSKYDLYYTHYDFSLLFSSFPKSRCSSNFLNTFIFSLWSPGTEKSSRSGVCYWLHTGYKPSPTGQFVWPSLPIFYFLP